MNLRYISPAAKETLRKNFSASHPPYDGDDSLHPDMRMISCPSELLYDNEWDVRYQSSENYILGDGPHFDPVTGGFFGVETISQDDND
jgi:hypothetical protein